MTRLALLIWVRGGAALLASVFLIGACAPPDSPISVNSSVQFAADTAAASLAGGLLNAYETRQPTGRFSLAHGSRVSVLSALAAGEIDAALLWFPVEDHRIFQTPVGYDLLAIIGSPEVGPLPLSVGDVQAIFSGHVTAWSVLGGPDQPIHVIGPELGDSTWLAFETLAFHGYAMTSSARHLPDGRNVQDLVSVTPGAIGCIAYSEMDGSVRPMLIEGVSPTRESARNRQYPFITSVVFASLEEPDGDLRAFLEWILSPRGQNAVGRYMLGLND